MTIASAPPLILSIHVGHNATAALGRDGEILGVLSQERCDYIKNSSGFPTDAIFSLLRQLNLKISDIDEVVVCSKEIYPPSCYDFLYNKKASSKNGFYGFFKRVFLSSPFFSSLFLPLRWVRKIGYLAEGERYLVKKLNILGLSDRSVFRYDHHICHAAAAFYSFSTSASLAISLRRPAVITLDGYGDDTCAAVFRVGNDNCLELVSRTSGEHSIGAMYAETTKYLGMKVLEHEYKVMGLAAYPLKKYFLPVFEKLFKDYITLDSKDGLKFKARHDPARHFYLHLEKGAHGERFDNIAAALQYCVETTVGKWVGNVVTTLQADRLFFGGGVFMNVKLNKSLIESAKASQYTFMPSCGDESLAIGGLYQHFSKRGIETKPLKSVFLGVSFTNEQVRDYLMESCCDNDFVISFHEDIDDLVAELLSQGKVVGRVTGRCEFGARSLGNRAVLGNPSTMETFFKINNQIKSRDFWMPFAPSILSEMATEYLEGYNSSRDSANYMMTAYKATAVGRVHLRAAVHQGDGTLRPQIVCSDANPRYHRLIKRFQSRTGFGGVLNTSLNIHGKPLNSTIAQAMDTLRSSRLRYLAIENYLVEKTTGAVDE